MKAAINDAFGEKAALMARDAIARRFGTCARDAGAVSAVVFILLMFDDYRQWDKKTAAIPRRQTSTVSHLVEERIVWIWQPL